MAFSHGELTLLDWAMPAAAPGALDIARFIAGCSSVVDASREQIIADYAEAAGPAYDEIAMRLSLLNAFAGSDGTRPSTRRRTRTQTYEHASNRTWTGGSSRPG
ncbi:MAG: hypothetical protein M3Q98_12765 [Actinomycetota bacterium]|nr:hypothetical protein [Actinomycetota bacterium]